MSYFGRKNNPLSCYEVKTSAKHQRVNSWFSCDVITIKISGAYGLMQGDTRTIFSFFLPRTFEQIEDTIFFVSHFVSFVVKKKFKMTASNPLPTLIAKLHNPKVFRKYPR